MKTKIHPFEASDMGPGPFKYTGCFSFPSQALQLTNPSAYNQAWQDLPKIATGRGSCAHCGAGIMHNFIIENTEGVEYVVGSTCVHKTDPELWEAVKVARRELESDNRIYLTEAKREAEAEKRELQRAKRFEEFTAKNPIIIKWIEDNSKDDFNQFARNMADGLTRYGSLTEGQIQAIHKGMKQAKARKNSEYVGTIGKRQEMALTIDHIFEGEGAAFSYHDDGIYYIVSFTDSSENCLSWFTKEIPANWEKGQTITVKATVKAHEVYRGTKQTKINRVKEV